LTPPQETIAAIATPPGRGGVGIVRVSGPRVAEIASAILGQLPPPRHARFARFRNGAGEVIDEGIALHFPAPHSFTGEDVLELQGHGGPVVLDLLLQAVLALGARPAAPGEFSRRAFQNGKLDLAQAEAVADLIESDTAAAARLAVRTLEGEFSRRVHALVERTVQLRMYVEAAIDFPEEEIDFLADASVLEQLRGLLEAVQAVERAAQVGRLLRDGLTLVIAGPPNAGKSSLLNALAGHEAAIVTEIPGTTRDVLRERIQLDGLPLHLIDTAGLRESTDLVEQEGIRRARRQIQQADGILWIFDGEQDPDACSLSLAELPPGLPLTLVRNKIDRTNTPPSVQRTPRGTEIALSAKHGSGLDLLRGHLKQLAGFHGSGEGEFLARRRHLEALDRAKTFLNQGLGLFDQGSASGDLLAEELRLAQNALAEITGEFTPDDLLGRIFESFCIGK